MSRVLYGVCGIGLGHLHRQLPIIDRCARICERVMIFAYGQSYEALSRRFSGSGNVRIVSVEVPYLAGNAAGLDFAASSSHPANTGKSYFESSCRALEAASRFIGAPDIVISDYEPVCASYAYAHGAPFVTIDQQSKYLLRQEWPDIAGLSCRDEIMRLRMFFPKAAERIACSFFRVPRDRPLEDVAIVGPILRNEILGLKTERRKRAVSRKVLVYLSSQQQIEQSMDDLVGSLSAQREWDFVLFLPPSFQRPEREPKNIRVLVHEQHDFLSELGSSAALVATAGHSLLSEAMHLAIPTYALPLRVYEQQVNAQSLHANGFGESHPSVEPKKLAAFLEALPDYRHRIEEDREILLREPGFETAWDRITGYLG